MRIDLVMYAIWTIEAQIIYFSTPKMIIYISPELR